MPFRGYHTIPDSFDILQQFFHAHTEVYGSVSVNTINTDRYNSLSIVVAVWSMNLNLVPLSVVKIFYGLI
jgi:hypothetical protein